MAMDFIEIEQRELGLVQQNAVIGAIGGIHGFGLQFSKAVAKLQIEPALLLEARRTDVIQQFVELLLVILVEPNAGRGSGGEQETGIDKLLCELGYLAGRVAVTPHGKQYDKYNHRFRHCCNCTTGHKSSNAARECGRMF